MEQIRMIQMPSGFYKVQQVMLFSIEGICWVDRSERDNFENTKNIFDEYMENGVPDFFGDDYYTTPHKEVIESGYCEKFDYSKPKKRYTIEDLKKDIDSSLKSYVHEFKEVELA